MRAYAFEGNISLLIAALHLRTSLVPSFRIPIDLGVRTRLSYFMLLVASVTM